MKKRNKNKNLVSGMVKSIDVLKMCIKKGGVRLSFKASSYVTPRGEWERK